MSDLLNTIDTKIAFIDLEVDFVRQNIVDAGSVFGYVETHSKSVSGFINAIKKIDDYIKMGYCIDRAQVRFILWWQKKADRSGNQCPEIKIVFPMVVLKR